MKELAAKYDAKAVENDRYANWISKGYFHAGDKSKDPFTIVIPPPNVTGKLHIGHALDNTLQDIICRYQRLMGKDVLYLPGMDHAGIATQAKVDERLKQQGISRYDIGREKFLEVAWNWKAEYGDKIHEQWAKLGNSLDYERERFTLDEGLNKAVNHVFVTLYNQGLIYQGERIINWDVEAKTALSNIEVYHKDVKGAMYHINYKVVETGECFEVATTRPETMFGDVCVVVHPEDERFKHLIGKHAINPANNESLPIIADDYIDLEFGSGAMKCTPAHDPNDFAIAERHHLDKILCMNPDGTMNERAGKYVGMDRFECRNALVEQLKADGSLLNIEEIIHSVGHSERTHVMVETYLSKQWFVKMKPLAADVIKAQSNQDTKINFYPARFEHTFMQWLENIEDWCISRQLWWGHRIPAWYHNVTGEIYVGENAPIDIENWHQDEDVLDTWFSSALWPFSTLGWPDVESDDYKRYYPTSLMVTGYDIIFFWVARMAFQGQHFTEHLPFKDCLIHGLVRDEQGRKMSKSLGNGIDPLDVIDRYGVDSLRFFLTTNATPGQDFRYVDSKVEACWNFINKIWNASRFVFMNCQNSINCELDMQLSAIDQWVLNKYNQTLAEVTLNMDRYELAIAGNALYNFVWDDFCSWYIELAKANLNSNDQTLVHSTQQTLLFVLKGIIEMLSPFMPFVMDEIYQALPNAKESVNLESWPKAYTNLNLDDVTLIDQAIEIIQKVREAKVAANAKPSLSIDIVVNDHQGHIIQYSDSIKALVSRMAKATIVDKLDMDLSVLTTSFGSIGYNGNALINVEEEIAHLTKEKLRLENEIKRGENMLNNASFLAKAPQAKVDSEKEKLESYRGQYETVIARLNQLSK